MVRLLDDLRYPAEVLDSLHWIVPVAQLQSEFIQKGSLMQCLILNDLNWAFILALVSQNCQRQIRLLEGNTDRPRFITRRSST